MTIPISGLFTPEKLEMAFGSFKKEKALGSDGIRPVVLQNLDGASLGEAGTTLQCQSDPGLRAPKVEGGKSGPDPKGGEKRLFLSQVFQANFPDTLPL